MKPWMIVVAVAIAVIGYFMFIRKKKVAPASTDSITQTATQAGMTNIPVVSPASISTPYTLGPQAEQRSGRGHF